MYNYNDTITELKSLLEIPQNTLKSLFKRPYHTGDYNDVDFKGLLEIPKTALKAFGALFKGLYQIGLVGCMSLAGLGAIIKAFDGEDTIQNLGLAIFCFIVAFAWHKIKGSQQS